MSSAIFGAGCFWNVEEAFRTHNGVTHTEAGYMGGREPDPSYQEVYTDSTGHVEVVHMTYDAAIVSYAELLGVFFGCHNPTQLNRQGEDVGTRYRSVIFVQDDAESELAAHAIATLGEAGTYAEPLATVIEPASAFYRAEEYHQQYIAKGGRCSI